MAKIKQPLKTKDFIKIKNCTICKGSPTDVSIFTAEPFTGKKCNTCFEIIAFKRITDDNSL